MEIAFGKVELSRKEPVHVRDLANQRAGLPLRRFS